MPKVRNRLRIVGTLSPHLPPRSRDTMAAQLTPELSGGLCAQIEPELFFPEPGDHHSVRIARGICQRCPIAATCLAAALEYEGAAGHSSRFGVWGGKTPNERYALYTRSRQSSAGASARGSEGAAA